MLEDLDPCKQDVVEVAYPPDIRVLVRGTEQAAGVVEVVGIIRGLPVALVRPGPRQHRRGRGREGRPRPVVPESVLRERGGTDLLDQERVAGVQGVGYVL